MAVADLYILELVNNSVSTPASLNVSLQPITEIENKLLQCRFPVTDWLVHVVNASFIAVYVSFIADS
jgi:hypothetical protein